MVFDSFMGVEGSAKEIREENVELLSSIKHSFSISAFKKSIKRKTLMAYPGFPFSTCFSFLFKIPQLVGNVFFLLYHNGIARSTSEFNMVKVLHFPNERLLEVLFPAGNVSSRVVCRVQLFPHSFNNRLVHNTSVFPQALKLKICFWFSDSLHHETTEWNFKYCRSFPSLFKQCLTETNSIIKVPQNVLRDVGSWSL